MAPDILALAGRVLRAIGPALRERAGPDVVPFVGALTEPLAEADDLVTPGPGPLATSPLSDLAHSPFPRWLAQAAGLRLPVGISVEDARRYVAGRGVSRRGTPAALIAAAQATLTGSRRVDLVERVGGNAYRVLLRTYSAETPDPAATLSAAGTEKPVGLLLAHEVRLGQSWGDVKRSGATWGDVKQLTIRQLREKVPTA